MRVLASDLGVNLNTVARAYRLLESRASSDPGPYGAEVLPRGRGAMLRAGPASGQELRGLLARMRQVGFSLEELKRLAQVQVTALGRRS